MNDFSNFSYINMITCKFNSANNHILKSPKILPCGFTACFDCIISNLQINRQLNCPFEKCKQVHEISDPRELISNAIVETAIEENMNFLTKNVSLQLQDKLDNLTKIYRENRENLALEFDSVEHDIKRRCELLIAEVRNIEGNLVSTVRLNRDKAMVNYEKKFEIITSEAYTMNNDLLKIKSEVEASKMKIKDMFSTELLKEELYKLQECLYHLDKLGLSLKEASNEVKFAPSLWLPQISNIGILVNINSSQKMNEMNMSNILQVANSSIVHLNCGISKVSKLCNLADKYLILLNTDDLKHELTILDENFALKARLSSIGSRKFKMPITLCNDEVENIYLCDYGHSEILILDFEFSVIKRAIGKKGVKSGEFSGLIDMCYSNNRLYVLDKSKRIQIFTKQGDFIREMKLYKSNSNDNDDDVTSSTQDCIKTESNERYIEHPLSLKVLNNTLAVLNNNNSIFIYNLDGYLNQIIHLDNINAFSLSENYLFILKEPSIFACYEYNVQENAYFNTITTVISNKNDIYSDMCFFKGRWIFSSYLTGRLSILLK